MKPLSEEEQSEVRVMREALKPLLDDKAKDAYIKAVTGAIAFVETHTKRKDLADRMRESLDTALRFWGDNEIVEPSMRTTSLLYELATLPPRTLRITSRRHADPIILKVPADLPDEEVQRLAGEEIAKKWGGTVSSLEPWE